MRLQDLAEYLGYGFISWAIGAALLEIHIRVFPDGKQENSFQYILDKILMVLSIIFLFLGSAASIIVELIFMVRGLRIDRKNDRDKAAALRSHLDEVDAAYLRGKNDGYLAGYNDSESSRPFVPPK